MFRTLTKHARQLFGVTMIVLSTSITPAATAAAAPIPNAIDVQAVELPSGLPVADLAVTGTSNCCGPVAKQYHFTIENKGKDKIGFHVHQRINFIDSQSYHQPTWDQVDSRQLYPGEKIYYHMHCNPPYAHTCGHATIFLENIKGIDPNPNNNMAVQG